MHLTTYEAVIDAATVHGWTCKLSKGRQGWTLDVMDGDDLIARGRSKQVPPACFSRIGTQVRIALEKSGKLG